MKKLLAMLSLLAVSQLTMAYDTTRYLPPLPLDKYLDNLYLKNTLGFRMHVPTTKQNVSINMKEVYVQREFTDYRTGLLFPGLELAVAQFNVAGGKAYNYSFGPSIAVPISQFGNSLTLVGRGKVHWLTKSDFQSGNNRKRYGGPVQWSYAVGMKYQISNNTYASYEWQHMSNGDRYEFNPALETHSFVVGVNF